MRQSFRVFDFSNLSSDSRYLESVTLKVPRTFAHLKSDPAHAQAEAQIAKSLLGVWNRPKIVLQTLSQLAIRFQALDRKLNVPRTFGNFTSDQALAKGESQSAKSFLGVWNRHKLVLQTLGTLAMRWQPLDRKLNVPQTFEHFRSDQAHALGEATVLKDSWHFGIGPI